MASDELKNLISAVRRYVVKAVTMGGTLSPLAVDLTIAVVNYDAAESNAMKQADLAQMRSDPMLPMKSSPHNRYQSTNDLFSYVRIAGQMKIIDGETGNVVAYGLPFDSARKIVSLLNATKPTPRWSYDVKIDCNPSEPHVSFSTYSAHIFDHGNPILEVRNRSASPISKYQFGSYVRSIFDCLRREYK
jgi:hypothetical protein